MRFAINYSKESVTHDVNSLWKCEALAHSNESDKSVFDSLKIQEFKENHRFQNGRCVTKFIWNPRRRKLKKIIIEK